MIAARHCIAGLLFLLTSVSHASGDLQLGAQYKVVGPIYATGVYENLNDRKLSYISLTAIQISGPEVAFRRSVPKGTTMRITSKASKRMPLPFYAKRYLVSLEPSDLPNVQIILELN